MPEVSRHRGLLGWLCNIFAFPLQWKCLLLYICKLCKVKLCFPLKAYEENWIVKDARVLQQDTTQASGYHQTVLGLAPNSWRKQADHHHLSNQLPGCSTFLAATGCHSAAPTLSATGWEATLRKAARVHALRSVSVKPPRQQPWLWALLLKLGCGKHRGQSDSRKHSVTVKGVITRLPWHLPFTERRLTPEEGSPLWCWESWGHTATHPNATVSVAT